MRRFILFICELSVLVLIFFIIIIKSGKFDEEWEAYLHPNPPYRKLPSPSAHPEVIDVLSFASALFFPGFQEGVPWDSSEDLLLGSSRSTSFSKRDSPNRFPVPMLISLRRTQGSGEGIGLGTDYSTIAVLFASDYQLGHMFPLIDMRVHRFDNSNYAANFGVGGRYVPEDSSSCSILGFNAYYDYCRGRLGNFNQVGLGVEVLGRRWDFRANGYIPIGLKKHKLTCVFDDYIGPYRATKRKREFASYGCNAEVGYLLTSPTKAFLFYAAAGPYYLTGHRQAVGGEARIRPQYKDYLAIDLRVSHDSVFKTLYQAEFIVYLPLYRLFCSKGKKGPCGITNRQIYQPIERFEIMPLQRKTCWTSNF